MEDKDDEEKKIREIDNGNEKCGDGNNRDTKTHSEGENASDFYWCNWRTHIIIIMEDKKLSKKYQGIYIVNWLNWSHKFFEQQTGNLVVERTSVSRYKFLMHCPGSILLCAEGLA